MSHSTRQPRGLPEDHAGRPFRGGLSERPSVLSHSERSREPDPFQIQFSTPSTISILKTSHGWLTWDGQIGIDSINVMYCRFYPERIRHLNIECDEDRLRDEDSLYYHQALSDRLVEEAVSLAQRNGIRFTHEPLFKENANPAGCRWPISQIMVGFGGEIYPCGGAEVHFKEKVEKGVYHFGNVLTERIDQLWNGEAYRSLRTSFDGRTGPCPGMQMLCE